MQVESPLRQRGLAQHIECLLYQPSAHYSLFCSGESVDSYRTFFSPGLFFWPVLFSARHFLFSTEYMRQSSAFFSFWRAPADWHTNKCCTTYMYFVVLATSIVPPYYTQEVPAEATTTSVCAICLKVQTIVAVDVSRAQLCCLPHRPPYSGYHHPIYTGVFAPVTAFLTTLRHVSFLVRAISPRIIDVEIIARGSPLVKVPRITFEVKVGKQGMTFHRQQFSLRLCYAVATRLLRGNNQQESGANIVSCRPRLTV